MRKKAPIKGPKGDYKGCLKSLRQMTLNNCNTAVGFTIGCNNTAVGFTIGCNNTAVGYAMLINMTTLLER